MFRKYIPFFEKIDNQLTGNYRELIGHLKLMDYIDEDNNFEILDRLEARDTPHNNKILLNFFKKNLKNPEIRDKKTVESLIVQYYKNHKDNLYGLDNYTDFAKLKNDYHRLNVKSDDKVVYKDKAYTIYETDDPDACRRLNTDSGWCVGRADGNWAHNYLQTGPFNLVTTTDKGKRVALIHFGTYTAHNVYNKPVKKSFVKDLYDRWGNEKLKTVNWEGKKLGEKL